MLTEDYPTLELSAPLVMRSPLATCKVCVVLPARDESQRIVNCLSALLGQLDFTGHPVNPASYEVIVLANNCRDDTAGLARAFGRDHPDMLLEVIEKEFSPAKSFVGYARKLLMDEAFRRFLLLRRSSGIIASTDSDTCVAPTWLAGILREVEAGAEAVGGRILADAKERSRLHRSAQYTYLRQVTHGFLLAELEHFIDPDPFDRFPRHANHNGASLAITAAAYAGIGGLPEVAEQEDSALYKAILRTGTKFRHSLDVQVTTSARLDGKVQHGFSAGLKMFNQLKPESSCLMAEDAAASEIRLQARRLVRGLNGEAELRPLVEIDVAPAARLLAISSHWLLEELSQGQPWGQLAEKIELRQAAEGQWERSWPEVFLDQAIAALRVRLSVLRSGGE